MCCMRSFVQHSTFHRCSLDLRQGLVLNAGKSLPSYMADGLALQLETGYRI